MTYIRGMMPFRDIPVLGGLLSLGDLIFAAVLALILTLIIHKLSSLSRPQNEDSGQSVDFNNILQRCYALFPIETVVFRGKTFTRGAMVKVKTKKNRTFEGRLIGRNSDNIVCIMTRSFIAADMLENIIEFEAITPEQ